MARKTATKDDHRQPPSKQPIQTPDRKRKRNTAKEDPKETQPQMKRKQIPYQTSTQTLKVGRYPAHTKGINEDASVEKSDKLENGANTDGTKSNRYRKASGGLSKAEKEEGELSPTRDSDDDAPPSPVSPVEDLDIRSPQYEVGEAICSQDVVDDNDADADDEDSENASVAGEVSGSESAGEDCSHEKNVAEHDEIYGKVESEGEAEGLHDANFAGGDGVMPPMSERFLLNVRPLAKYVPLELCDKANKDARVFYGNDNYYVLLRLHQVNYYVLCPGVIIRFRAMYLAHLYHTGYL
ncbi:hypothetical protein QQ045_032594 [Rhodiola kirilowii]